MKMWKAGLLALAGALAAPFAAAAPAAAPPKPLVIKAARLFDGRSDRVVTHGVLIVEGSRIAAAGQDLPVPAGAEVIDLGDATLLPGFIDAHVHLSEDHSDVWLQGFYNRIVMFPAEQALHAAANARITLLAGFTTVRDAGSNDWVALGLRNAINAGIAEGPRMLVSNYPVSATGGHGDGYPIPPDRLAPRGPLTGICNGADECRAAVRYQIKYGADVIKCMPSGGVLSLADPVDAPELTAEEMNAIVDEAHRWGRKVMAHCHGDAAARIAIAAGVDSIEHGSFLKPETLALMKQKGTYLVATLSAGEWVGAKADTYPPSIAAKARAASAAMKLMFRDAVRIGVPLGLGTDAAVMPHGINAREFGYMVEGGLSPAAALRSGTSADAELLGVADRLGTLEKGKLADVVAVPGDPLADIHQTEHVFFVMKEGRVVKNAR